MSHLAIYSLVVNFSWYLCTSLTTQTIYKNQQNNINILIIIKPALLSSTQIIAIMKTQNVFQTLYIILLGKFKFFIPKINS